MTITSKCMSFTANNIYGEYNHVLAENEMPEHRHHSCHYIQGNPQWNDAIHEEMVAVTRFGAYFPGSSIDVGSTGYTIGETNNVFTVSGAYTLFAGNNNPHNNIQPCITVYFWKRTI